MLSLCFCSGFSLVAKSRVHSPGAVLRLLTEVASPVAELGLQGAWASVGGVSGSKAQAQ